MDMATQIRIAWRPVPDLSPARAQDARIVIDGADAFSISVRPGAKGLACLSSHGIVAGGRTMRQCKAAVEHLVRHRGDLLQ